LFKTAGAFFIVKPVERIEAHQGLPILRHIDRESYLGYARTIIRKIEQLNPHQSS